MRRSRHEHTPTADDLTASPPSTPHKRHRRDGDDAIATSVELNVAHLPRELLSHIISYLKRIELLRNASAVCREWRLVALTLISSLTPKSFSRGLLAKMTGLKKMCVGCLGKHRHSHPIELPGVRDLSLSSSDVCDCALWTRLPSLTALTIFLRKTHPCALSVLSKVASSLQKLTLGQEDEIFDPPLTEIVSTVTLPALRELHLIRQESVNFACILLSNAGLAARLTSLTIQVCSSDHQSPAHLTALLATIPMPSLTSASLLFKPSAAAISAFLDRAPALKELALGVHTGVFGAVAAQVSSLLVGLHLVHPDAQTVGFVRLCTRLTAIVPLPATASGGQYWDESNWAPLYIPLAPLLLKLRQPATAKLGTFTSLTSLRICSKFSAFCEDIRLPHLRKIAWGLYPYSTEEPTHKVAYIMRRFLSWSDVLYRISCKLPGLTFRTAADTDEMTFFLNLAERHPALEELSFRFKEAQFDDTDVQTLMKTRRNLRIKCKKDPMRPAAVGDAPVVPQPVALAAAVNNAAQAPVHLPPPPAANVPPPPPPAAPGGQQ